MDTFLSNTPTQNPDSSSSRVTLPQPPELPDDGKNISVTTIYNSKTGEFFQRIDKNNQEKGEALHTKKTDRTDRTDRPTYTILKNDGSVTISVKSTNTNNDYTFIDAGNPRETITVFGPEGMTIREGTL